MPRNVEIKARVSDIEAVKNIITDLKSSSVVDNDNDDDMVVSVIIKQDDTFYNLPPGKDGKLKLRKVKGFHPELIFYNREESAGPKLSLYNKCTVPDALENMLKDALGTLGVVKKTRTVIIIGQTRVHFDNVEGLGDFVELEVVLDDDQTIEEGQKIAMDLMSQMGVEEKDLISTSYLKMLQDASNASRN